MTDLDPAGLRGRTWRVDLIVAVVLVAILSTVWAITDWPRLGRMLLPDPDDMMRLVQVRDWIAGQGINDWTQYRMAPPAGSAMHWSRINDVGIAAIILTATPLLGQYHAELLAILLYPALLFAAATFLSARIARRLWGDAAGSIAAVLTVLAYPGTTVFIPGRIDHHALQVVLIQLFVLLLMRAATARNGLMAGAIAALSLIVGLETAPQVGALIMVLFIAWVVGGSGQRERLGGFAAGLAAVTLIFFLFLRPEFWTAEYCDAFTPASVTGALAGAAALGVLAIAQPVLRDWRMRLAAGAVLGGGALGATLLAYPNCISGPYGQMDPFLLRAFLPYIDEANGLFAEPGPAKMVAIGGLLSFAGVVSIGMAIREFRRWAVMLPLTVVIVISAIVMLAQVRGVYIGAPLCAAMLSGLVVWARKRGRLPLIVAAWCVSAGMVYVTIADQLAIRFAATPAVVANIQAPKVHVLCSEGDTWAQVDRAPRGVIMAGTSIAAYVIGVTHHATVGAGYHRNDAGNMAMYRFFLGKPARARAIARQWRVNYVLFCPGDFDEIDVERNFPDGIAAGLRAGRVPDWLEPIALNGTPMHFYRVR